MPRAQFDGLDRGRIGELTAEKRRRRGDIAGVNDVDAINPGENFARIAENALHRRTAVADALP